MSGYDAPATMILMILIGLIVAFSLLIGIDVYDYIRKRRRRKI